MCVCVCVCACARARACVCVCVCDLHTVGTWCVQTYNVERFDKANNILKCMDHTVAKHHTETKMLDIFTHKSIVIVKKPDDDCKIPCFVLH